MDALVQLGAKMFVILFFVGVIGSMIVVVISFVEDFELLVETDEPSSVDATLTRA
jgi:hypothetical protein